jgi:fatty-acyl-CoA synthase
MMNYQEPRKLCGFVTAALFRTSCLYLSPSRCHHSWHRHISWRETYLRCRQFASQLQKLGITKNDTVSVLLPNVPAMIEAHFAVPMTGAVLNTLNTRLDAKTIAFMLEHAETKVLLVDPEFASVAQEALALVKRDIFVIDVDDAEYENCFAAPDWSNRV